MPERAMVRIAHSMIGTRRAVRACGSRGPSQVAEVAIAFSPRPTPDVPCIHSFARLFSVTLDGTNWNIGWSRAPPAQRYSRGSAMELSRRTGCCTQTVRAPSHP